MLFSAESGFANFLADAFAVFVFILWFWLFITVASDLFRRNDVSGLGKVLWVILVKLDRLIADKSISKEEYARLRARIVD